MRPRRFAELQTHALKAGLRRRITRLTYFVLIFPFCIVTYSHGLFWVCWLTPQHWLTACRYLLATGVTPASIIKLQIFVLQIKMKGNQNKLWELCVNFDKYSPVVHQEFTESFKVVKVRFILVYRCGIYLIFLNNNIFRNFKDFLRSFFESKTKGFIQSWKNKTYKLSIQQKSFYATIQRQRNRGWNKICQTEGKQNYLQIVGSKSKSINYCMNFK